MNTIIVGDIHGKLEYVKHWLAKTDVNVLFVGDFVDSFDRSIDEQVECFQLVIKHAKERDNIDWLPGNHEYGYVSSTLKCSGYSRLTQMYINPYIGDIIRKPVYKWIGDILVTHAGLNRSFFDWEPTIEEVQTFLENMNDEIIHQVGYFRGGNKPFGGPLWNDFWREHRSLANVRQIMGHTALSPECNGVVYTGNGDYCIDCLDTKREVIEIDNSNSIAIVSF